ncbi:MAG: efflux RND transporter permease subunit [Verrucomicrobiales bacterium]|nr:efflux RND transporter permease subunit [Verrucomicrobiales bacterium]
MTDAFQGLRRLRLPHALPPRRRHLRRIHLHAAGPRGRRFRDSPAGRSGADRGRQRPERSRRHEHHFPGERAPAPCRHRPRPGPPHRHAAALRLRDPPGESRLRLRERLHPPGRIFKVYAQADAPYRADPGAIRRLELRGASGKMIPLGSLANVEETFGPQTVTRFNLYPSVKILGQPEGGFS